MRFSNSSIGASVALLLSGTVASGQSFDVGSNGINLGLGLGGGRYSYITGVGNYRVSPAFVLSYDRGITQLGPGVLAIGGMIANQTVKYEYNYTSIGYTYNYDRRWSNTLVGARGTWHWNDWHGNDKLDLYAGVFAGYNIGTYRNKSTRTVNGVTTTWDDGYSATSSYLRSGVFAGCRYLFTEKFGVYGELGYGIAYLNAGVTLVL